jgi:hypothetical protein
MNGRDFKGMKLVAGFFCCPVWFGVAVSFWLLFLAIDRENMEDLRRCSFSLALQLL